MLTWPSPLQAGDKIAIVAPSARYLGHNLPKLRELLSNWQLEVLLPADLQGHDVLCANTDELRLQHLQHAFLADDIKAIWCLRGGYGSTRLLPALIKLPKPKIAKLFIGFSDITALHIFLQQHWGWATLHGPVAGQLADDKIPAEVVNELKSFLFGQQRQLEFTLEAINAAAQQANNLHSSVTGGNLCLVQTSIGTAWQIDARNKILLLEDTNERGYQIDRMLTHLEQAGIFAEVSAVMFGDFTGGLEDDGNSTIPCVLQRFANSHAFPVLWCRGVGHDVINHPMPLGVTGTLQLGRAPKLLFDSFIQS